ncbi:MAG: hypothetical protein ISS82_05170 [Nanoarchaeota archaeon]|nr:hypothetical protein [Nanoarchaeota archaeon]
MIKDKSIYINVGDSIGIRRDILGTNIGLINLLKKYEYLKEIRNNKHKGFVILKELLKDINNDFLKFRNELPYIEHKKEERIKLKVEENKFITKHRKVNKELTSLEREMERLKLQLREIR